MALPDFGNKFGQPLISGSCLTFEMSVGEDIYAYDKVIMLAGGVGYGILEQSKRKTSMREISIIVLGGDNYRIGLEVHRFLHQIPALKKNRTQCGSEI